MTGAASVSGWAIIAVLALGLISLYGIFSYGQDAPLDASEISRDLLYLAPSHAEKRATGTAYVGMRFEYTQQGEKNWSILPVKPNKTETSREKQRVTEFENFELVGASDDDRATLALRQKGSQEA